MLKGQITSMMPEPLKSFFVQLREVDYESLQEIRIRVGQPLVILKAGKRYGLGSNGTCNIKMGYKVSKLEVEHLLKCMSDFSLYALEEEVRQGFITLQGGHRVGLVGRAVLEHGRVKTLRYISGMNIRLAHQIIGCSDELMSYILGRDRVYHTLIISPPGCGKTTLLRDTIRSLSSGFSGYGPYAVGVVDERSEIAACHEGVPQNELGYETDVLDACPKEEGMRMILRSMGEDVVAVDEIGKEEECDALRDMLNAGVTVVCTAHGKNMEECMRRPGLKALIEEGLFERIIVLSKRNGPCTIEEVRDGISGLSLLR